MAKSEEYHKYVPGFSEEKEYSSKEGEKMEKKAMAKMAALKKVKGKKK